MFFRRDRIDIRSIGGKRESYAALIGTLLQQRKNLAHALFTVPMQKVVERIKPFFQFGLIDAGDVFCQLCIFDRG